MQTPRAGRAAGEAAATESKGAPAQRREVPLGCARMVAVRVTSSSAGAPGAGSTAVPAARPGLALRGADVATGRHAVWIAGDDTRAYVPVSSLTHEWRPATVPLPCEVAVWALRGGGHETAVLIGYEEAEPGSMERALTVPWGHVEHHDGTVVDAARRVI